MFGKYKVVVNTAAGRRRYMQYLVPPIIVEDIVDRYDIWVNTTDKIDIAFLKDLAATFPKVNLVWQPDGAVDGIKSINAFYKNCCDEDTIYMKIDDDVIWLEPDLFRKMVHFRISNPDYFLVSPLVINNALSTYLLQIHNKIKLNEYYMSIGNERTICLDGWFAADLHDWFIEGFLKKNRFQELYVGKHPQGMGRFSINCILWFGSELKKFNGIIPGDDEEFMSCIKPTQLGLCNCFNGDAIISHFAFGTQRKVLEKKDILGRYGEVVHALWLKNEKLKYVDSVVQNIIKTNEGQAVELLNLDCPLKQVEQPKVPIIMRLLKSLPDNVRASIRELTRTQLYNFIER